MTALLVSIPVSLGLGLIGLWAFFWALRHGQFDDPDGNAWRVIETEGASEMADERNRMASHPDNGATAPDPIALALAINKES